MAYMTASHAYGKSSLFSSAPVALTQSDLFDSDVCGLFVRRVRLHRHSDGPHDEADLLRIQPL